MMEALQKKARALLEGGTVKVVIGYAAGSRRRARPGRCSLRNPEQAQQLIWDDRCRQNLATYLLKPEVKALGKPALVARTATLRTLLQYAVENQLVDEAVLALAVADGQVVELPNFAAIEEYLAKLPRGLTRRAAAGAGPHGRAAARAALGVLGGRAGPLRQVLRLPGGVPAVLLRPVHRRGEPAAVDSGRVGQLGNLEWNVVRAMHLAGRCVDCGSCADACPENIRHGPAEPRAGPGGADALRRRARLQHPQGLRPGGLQARRQGRVHPVKQSGQTSGLPTQR